MTDVSAHAIQRAGDRVSKQAQKQAHQFFERLWGVGRTASDADLKTFSTLRLPGLDYRLAVHDHARFLIVRGADGGRFVTLIRDGRRYE